MKSFVEIFEYDFNYYDNIKSDLKKIRKNLNLNETEFFLYIHLFILNKLDNSDLIAIAKSNSKSNKYLLNGFSLHIEESLDFIDTKDFTIKFLEKSTLNKYFILEFNLSNHKLVYTFYQKIDKKILNKINSYFKNILFNWIKNPKDTINSLEYIPKDDYNKLLQYSKNFNYDMPKFETIFDMFFNQYKLNPEKEILIEYIGKEKKSYTYKDLYLKILSISSKINELNIAKNSIVCVYLDRGANLITTLLALLLNDLVYMPIDTSFPKYYIDDMINDANPDLIITDKEEDFGVLRLDISICSNNVIEDSYINKPSLDFNRNMSILYTSGSTGKPKGVIINQIQILNKYYWMKEKFNISENEIFGQRCTISTIPSFWDLLAGLLLNRKTIIIPENIIKNPPKLVDFISENNISFITLIPSMLRVLSKVKNSNNKLLNLKNIITLGEKFTFSDYNICKKLVPNALIINDYGSTETNTILVETFHPNNTKKNFVGMKPIKNISTYILDEKNNLCGFYVIGELTVSGNCLFNGYLNSFDLTNKKRESIYIDDEYKTVYRTGDLALMTEEGYILLLGRKDTVFKINGKRIDLDGINSLIQDIELIDDSCTVGYSTNNVNTIFSIIKTSVNIQEKDLLKIIYHNLENKIPNYMIPREVKLVEKIPILPNGKRNLQKIEEIFLKKSKKTLDLTNILNIFSNLLNINVNDNDILDTEFKYLGMDSLKSMEILNKLEENFNLDLDISVLYNNPTINKLVSFLKQQFDFTDDIENNSNFNTKCAPEFAIIGMSGIFPGANNTEELWENLCNGVESISKFSNKEQSTHENLWGGFLKYTNELDMSYFNLYPNEINNMSKFQKLAIIESYRTIENSGYNLTNNKLKETGVFIGGLAEDIELKEYSTDSVLGHNNALIAERISYLYNFTGPSIMIDTACSSSLAALHQACLSLKNNDCYNALVGGINLLDENFYIKTNKLNVLSNDGKTKTFNDNANGFVPGECAAFIMVKKLKDALNDNDNILATIRGTVINQDGRSNGITAPNGNSQENLLKKIYTEKAINLQDIDYIETHGTGTKIGDVIEINALSNFFKSKKGKCFIGSIKPNIGHLIYAAGIASLIKAILIIQKRQFVPNINVLPLNKKINWNDIPLDVITENTKISNPKPLTIAISSFGIGGTNTHCIIEEYTVKNNKYLNENPIEYSFPLYSPNAKALKKYISNFQSWCSLNKDKAIDLKSLSYTLNFDRNIFKHGLVILAKNIDELITLLNVSIEENLTPDFKFKTIGTINIIAPNDSYKFNEVCTCISSNKYFFENKNSDYNKIRLISSYDYYEDSVDEKIKSASIINIISNYITDKNLLDIHKKVDQLGLDSINIMSLKDQLNKYISNKISISDLYNYDIAYLVKMYENINTPKDIINKYLDNNINFNTITTEEIETLFEYLNGDD